MLRVYACRVLVAVLKYSELYSGLLLSTILVLLAINLAKATAFGTATTRTVETNLFQCYETEKKYSIRYIKRRTGRTGLTKKYE